MKQQHIIWTILILVTVGFLGGRLVLTEHGYGKSYVKQERLTFVEVPADPDQPGGETTWIPVDGPEALDYQPDTLEAARDDAIGWNRTTQVHYNDFLRAEADDPDQDAVILSWPRTIGLWLGAFFTLAILSFLYRDNPFYKIAEASVVGVSAAYWMVSGFWKTIVPNLFGRLFPETVNQYFLPGAELQQELTFLIPLVLGIMLLCRLLPGIGWISRWPMAFIIGVFCGWRLVRFLQGDFLNQIRNSIEPVIVMGSTGFELGDSIRNAVLIIGVLSCLTYFFFSIEHRGVVGRTARVGIWFLMVTFGAAFGYTVMGRIALLAIRLEFLFDDWLWLIDPKNTRSLIDATSMITGTLGIM